MLAVFVVWNSCAVCILHPNVNKSISIRLYIITFLAFVYLIRKRLHRRADRKKKKRAQQRKIVDDDGVDDGVSIRCRWANKKKTMHYLQAVFIRELISTTMDSDTFQLIQKLCNEFKLSPDIEFTCYEAYMAYFRSYFVDLQRRLQQKTMQLNGNGNANTTINTDIAREVSVFATNEFIDKLLHEVEQTSLLHTLALISICAKYINGFRSAQLFNHFSAYLQLNGTPYSIAEIRHSEYIVFKFVGFNVSFTPYILILFHICNRGESKKKESFLFDLTFFK